MPTGFVAALSTNQRTAEPVNGYNGCPTKRGIKSHWPPPHNEVSHRNVAVLDGRLTVMSSEARTFTPETLVSFSECAQTDRRHQSPLSNTHGKLYLHSTPIAPLD